MTSDPSTSTHIFEDRRWETFGLLKEAYLAVSDAIDREMSAREPVDPAVADLVFRLARTPGQALRGIDITRALFMSTTSTTRLLDRAERLGLVIREPHPTDRRSVLVRLTPSGADTARRWAVSALDAAEHLVHDRLSADEEQTLTVLLRRLRDAAAQASNPDGPFEHRARQRR